jgi:hypothetical protein
MCCSGRAQIQNEAPAAEHTVRRSLEPITARKEQKRALVNSQEVTDILPWTMQNSAADVVYLPWWAVSCGS